ncbi:MAG: M15 family metallopeptidase [Pseudolabrys sp.]
MTEFSRAAVRIGWAQEDSYLLSPPSPFMRFALLRVVPKSHVARRRTTSKSILTVLVRSYPDQIVGYDAEFLILKNGVKFRISDGRTNKTFQELLERPDIDDMFYARYPVGAEPIQPAKNSDPGRVRFEALFVAMYGDCNKSDVTKNLRTVNWLPKHGGGKIAITAVNGVVSAFENVSRELDEMPDQFVKYLVPTGGTYNCRRIAGSRARSMHAYGAAIDISTKFADYWRWDSTDWTQPRWRNRIPIEIVRIFEKQGFIWGGYWYHFDTMHFEYRPELLAGRL